MISSTTGRTGKLALPHKEKGTRFSRPFFIGRTVELRQTFLGEDLGQLNGWLIERVDAEKAACENRLQHEVH